MAPLWGGCIGWNVPQPIQSKPYTYFKGGDQLGRDTMTNRRLVAQFKVPLGGRGGNEVLSILGQPQDIRIRARDVSEDWYYVYYKNYIPYTPQNPLDTDPGKGVFLVRFYHEKVIDVVKVE